MWQNQKVEVLYIITNNRISSAITTQNYRRMDIQSGFLNLATFLPSSEIWLWRDNGSCQTTAHARQRLSDWSTSVTELLTNRHNFSVGHNLPRQWSIGTCWRQNCWITDVNCQNHCLLLSFGLLCTEQNTSKWLAANINQMMAQWLRNWWLLIIIHSYTLMNCISLWWKIQSSKSWCRWMIFEYGVQQKFSIHPSVHKTKRRLYNSLNKMDHFFYTASGNMEGTAYTKIL